MNAQTSTDAQLMARVAGGDVDAFETIYDRYHVQAYSLAHRIAGRVGAADEATQDAFLALWRSAARFDPQRAGLRTWLLTLVRHRSIDALRRRSAAPLQEWSEDAVAGLASDDCTEERVLAEEDGRAARRLVAELPEEQRKVIELAYFGGYTQTEISKGLGVPLGTVKSRARLGLDNLRRASPALA
jgi:RNA polymerase sigma-70 factor (ECF subfamily)